MTVKFIVTLGRHHPPEANEPSVEAALEHRGDVVALDVAGPEDVSLERFAPLIRRGREAGLGLTIHAGEARGPDSVREALRLGATRLGHGVGAVEDKSLLEDIRRGQVAFEICLTSNHQTGAVRTPGKHPLPELLKAGHRVTLNTDDPTVCNTTLVREYAQARRLGLKDPDFERVTDHAVKGAFLTGAERKELAGRLEKLKPGRTAKPPPGSAARR